MWLEVIAILVAYALIIGVLSAIIYEVAKRSRRKRFLNEVAKLVETDLDDDVVVSAIYHQAHHYMQSAESVRSALTHILSNQEPNSQDNKVARLINLIDKNGELSALMSLPDPIRPVLQRVYSNFADARQDITHAAWQIKEIEIRSGNKKVLAKIFGFVTAGVTLLTVVFKFFTK